MKNLSSVELFFPLSRCFILSCVSHIFAEAGINGEAEPKALNLVSPTRLAAAQQQLTANTLQQAVVQVLVQFSIYTS